MPFHWTGVRHQKGAGESAGNLTNHVTIVAPSRSSSAAGREKVLLQVAEAMAHHLVKKTSKKVHDDNVYACAISPDGTFVATGGEDVRLCITNIATLAKVFKIKFTTQVNAVAWSPDGTRLVAVRNEGFVNQVANNNALSNVYRANVDLFGCAFSPSGILAVGGADKAVTLLDSAKNYSLVKQIPGLTEDVHCLAFSSNGDLFAVGCDQGKIYIFGMKASGNWSDIVVFKHHSDTINSICFSPSGRMLLATCSDDTASICHIPSKSTWESLDNGKYPSSRHLIIRGHSDCVVDGVFFSDESHVIAATDHLYVWRTSDGMQTANYKCKDDVTSMSYHAASGNMVIALTDGAIQVWQTDPHIATSLQRSLPDHVCVRERLAAAQAQANEIQATIEKADDGLRQQLAREKELRQSIADLEAKLASEKKALGELQTAESREFNSLIEHRDMLLGIVHMCTQTLDSLTDCLSVSGLADLRGNAFKEWLCDIGMRKLQTALKDIDGTTLSLFNVSDVMENGVSFIDAAALLLRGYIAHCKLNDDSAFTPPRGSVLSWDEVQTANWIDSLGAPFTCLSDARWHGAALCSLSPTHVVETSKGALKVADAVKFLTLIKAERGHVDGDKATWVSKWSGVSTIDNQA